MTAEPSWLLIADDNEHNRDYLKQVLDGLWPVEFAVNGAEALSLLDEVALAERLPAAFLLDISMPVCDGWEVLRQIRTHPELSGLKVFACTAHTMAGDRERVFAAGFDGYLPKPYGPKQLIEFLEHQLGPAPGCQPAGEGAEDWTFVP